MSFSSKENLGKEPYFDFKLMNYYQELIGNEFHKASLKYEKFNSAHEGYAVLLEEVDELWQEIKLKQSQRDLQQITKEAIQVGAMALRFLYDLCPDLKEASQ